jgi:hypothetical protein
LGFEACGQFVSLEPAQHARYDGKPLMSMRLAHDGTMIQAELKFGPTTARSSDYPHYSAAAPWHCGTVALHQTDCMSALMYPYPKANA